MSINTYTLPNGLRIIHEDSPTNVIYCGYAVNAATRDEKPEEEGIAHFVEHMIFKGTTHRKAWHILNRMEAVGGDLNAFTQKEETTIYATCLKDNFCRAVDLLTDITFHSIFPENEMKKETEVIIEEIQSYEDSPSDLIFDEFENLVFKGHPLGRNILGHPEQLRTYHPQNILDFTQRFYIPSNTIFFIKGHIPFETILKEVEKATHELPSTTVIKLVEPLPLYKPTYVEKKKDTHQAHVMIGCRSFAPEDHKRTGLYVLNNILGGPGMNALLNVSLRERRGLVYNVESNLTNYTDTGVFSIYFGCEPKDVNKCLRLVKRELQKLIDTPLTDRRLSAAKKQIKGEIGIACDSFENCALDMARSFLHYNKFETLNDLFHRIDKLSAIDLQSIASELFNEENLTTLIYK